jgi:alpha-tubulin suppressor-like RCC1 family protein
MTIATGDRLTALQCTDKQAVVEIKRCSWRGERFVLLQCIDGTQVAIKVLPVKRAEERGIKAKTSDNKTVLVRFIGDIDVYSAGSLLSRTGTNDQYLQIESDYDLAYIAVGIGQSSPHAIAIGYDTFAYSWGTQNKGQLGDGVGSSTETRPIPVSLPSSCIHVETGYDTSFFVTDTYDGYACGSGSQACLGDGTLVDKWTPVPISGGHKFKRIVHSSPQATRNNVHGLTDVTDSTDGDGILYVWGSGARAWYYTGAPLPLATTAITEPLNCQFGQYDQSKTLHRFSRIESAQEGAIAIDTDGVILSTGSDYGLGHATPTIYSTTLSWGTLAEAGGALADYTAWFQYAGLVYNGQPCWGIVGRDINSTWNGLYHWYDGSRWVVSDYFGVKTGAYWVCSEARVDFISRRYDPQGTATGQYSPISGSTSTRFRWEPIPFFSGKKVIDIACGFTSYYALTDDGRVWGWGSRQAGAMNDGYFGGSFLTYQTPVEITGFDAGVPVTKIGAIRYGCVALDYNGQLWGWGQNFYKELGTPTSNILLTKLYVQPDQQPVQDIFTGIGSVYVGAQPVA